MTKQTKRIAINVGWGYVPGLNAVITGTALWKLSRKGLSTIVAKLREKAELGRRRWKSIFGATARTCSSFEKAELRTKG